MSAILFSRFEFNNLLNYGDVRSAEVYLEVDGHACESSEYVTEFTSNLDVVTDFVSAKKISKLLTMAKSYVLKVTRHYPFHEAFVRDCVKLSMNHLHAYTPCVIAAKSALIRIRDSECYIRHYEGNLSGVFGDQLLPFGEKELLVDDFNIFVLYRPNSSVHREIQLRSFRRQAAKHKRVNRYSDYDPEIFAEAVDSIFTESSAGTLNADEYFQSLLQFWPCGASGRLSSFIHMYERTKDLVAEPVLWNLRLEESWAKDIQGRYLNLSESVAQALTDADNDLRRIEIPRDSETDLLVTRGLLSYRALYDWRWRGWIEVCSQSNPCLQVRTDGKRRWLAYHHGGIESIESVITGRNLATGGAFIEKQFSSELIGKRVAFLGLGLGVIQRHWVTKCDITTVEHDTGVIELYETLYSTSSPEHKIVFGDFFQYICSGSEYWDILVLDCFQLLDSKLQALIGSLVVRLSESGIIILNNNGRKQEFCTWVESNAILLNMDAKVWALEFDQSVAALRRRRVG